MNLESHYDSTELHGLEFPLHQMADLHFRFMWDAIKAMSVGDDHKRVELLNRYNAALRKMVAAMNAVAILQVEYLEGADIADAGMDRAIDDLLRGLP